MQLGHPHVCLFQPEIPQNTGNIGRLCAATGSRLHLIKPFGFSMEDKNVRRPGLDYWPFLDLEIHENFDQMLSVVKPVKMAMFSKFGKQNYDQIPDETNLFVFGRETSGFPQEWHEKYADSMYKIPMFHPGVRSLNLSNAVAVIVYDHIKKLYQQ